MPTEILRERNDLVWMAGVLIPAIVENRKREEQKLLPAPEQPFGLLVAPTEESPEVKAKQDFVPRMKSPTNGKFYDINKNEVGEVVGAFLEESVVTDIQERINRADPMKMVNGEPQIDFSNYNEHSPAEIQATLSAFRLAQEGYNLIFWISPPSKIYIEARLNVYLVEGKGNNLMLKGIGIPLKINKDKAMRMAKKMVERGGFVDEVIQNEEDVRRQAIGFKLEDDKEWIDKCKDLIPQLDNVWEFLRKGGDVKRKKEVEQAVRIAKEKAGGNNYIFERLMWMMGFGINAEGGHGSSWLGNGGLMGIFNFNVELMGGQIAVEAVRKNGKLICPICGEEIGDGVTICPKCKVRIK